MANHIIGRTREKQLFDKLSKVGQAKFAVVYGRRRVGKTYFVREYFDNDFAFQITGLANANTEQQLFNFHTSLNRQSQLYWDTPPIHWLEAFQRLIDHLEDIGQADKIVIFFDEMPWMDTAKSDFLIGLENFWNSWASSQSKILLIACGSAASWMLNKVINNHGGLHNRVTDKLKMEPFSLKEAEELLKYKGCVLDRYQIVELYMTLGGIPFYLDKVEPGKSVAQIIEELLIAKNALLRNEFYNLYRSLFKNHERYETIVKALSTKKRGLSRDEILEKTGLASGGTFTTTLNELEESGFISSYAPLDKKRKNTLYRLSDFYTSFFFQFIYDQPKSDQGNWLSKIDHPQHRAWLGFAFEQVCMQHIDAVKSAIGIRGIHTESYAWQGEYEGQGAQIDLLIDRRDQVINLCEMKFSLAEFTIDKSYAEILRRKIQVFKDATKTKKAVFLTFITTYGVKQNEYKGSLVQNEVMMDDLFG